MLGLFFKDEYIKENEDAPTMDLGKFSTFSAYFDTQGLTNTNIFRDAVELASVKYSLLQDS